MRGASPRREAHMGPLSEDLPYPTTVVAIALAEPAIKVNA
jgi:hypothetical protein